MTVDPSALMPPTYVVANVGTPTNDVMPGTPRVQSRPVLVPFHHAARSQVAENTTFAPLYDAPTTMKSPALATPGNARNAESTVVRITICKGMQA